MDLPLEKTVEENWNVLHDIVPDEDAIDYDADEVQHLNYLIVSILIFFIHSFIFFLILNMAQIDHYSDNEDDFLEPFYYDEDEEDDFDFEDSFESDDESSDEVNTIWRI